MHGSYSHRSYRARLVWREKAITEARLQLARFLEAEALVEQKKFAAVEEYTPCDVQCAVRTLSQIIIPAPQIVYSNRRCGL